MEPYEIAYLEATVDTLATGIASAMRDGTDDFEVVESENRLTAYGKLWIRGYLTSRLSIFRASARGNPNLSQEDLERIAEFVEEHQAGFAAELYS